MIPIIRLSNPYYPVNTIIFRDSLWVTKNKIEEILLQFDGTNKLFDMVLSILEENTITPYTVKSPNTNPIKGRVKFPKKDIFIPSIITIPAPNDAPDDTPSV